MGTTQSQPLESGDVVFTNQMVMERILGALPRSDVRKLRRINKTSNTLACCILNIRQNPALNIATGKAVASFIDTMEKRLEDRVPYSAFSLVVSRISLESIHRFGSVLTSHVRKLEINFVDIKNWTFYLWAMTDHSATKHWNNGKVKSLQLLSFFPNVEELHLEFRDDKDNYLSPEELSYLPQTFPRLLVFQVSDRDASFDQQENVQENAVTFLSAIMKRSPILQCLNITKNETRMTTSLAQVPGLISEFGCHPALALNTSFMLSGAPGEYPRHLQFVREITDMGYNKLSSLDLWIVTPTDALIIELNDFLELQAKTMASLTLYVSSSQLIASRQPLNLPAMPSLVSLEIQLRKWALIDIRPFPLSPNPELFPKIQRLQIQHNTGWLKKLMYGDVHIVSTSTSKGASI